ncbi:hypothetical protein [Halococcus sp. IIIV-5B]|uniref:hypothetical protein n=1 Tax=Halococcus sp. IIIV-5B TaxID=2321230 RepID=UPI000E70AF32|nr:hypothetical protein [Halococcus sp. IIIV-5B]RJS98105.1 hypothetical protein D3261_17600 [Halococcus sp. IIIV-5B]
MSRDRRRVLAVVVVGLVPWVVLFYPGGQEAYFSAGLLSYTGNFVTLPAYLSRAVPDFLPFASVFSILPQRLLAWPTSVGLWLLALASSLLGSYEDRRVTDGLLVVAGLSQLTFALGFWTAEGYVAVPIGAVLLVGLGVLDWRSSGQRWLSASRE